MVGNTSYAFDSLDLFAVLSQQPLSIPYPLAQASQLTAEQIADRRRVVMAANESGDPRFWVLEPIVRACAGWRHSVDLRYAVDGREFGAVVLLDDADLIRVVSCQDIVGQARLVAAHSAVSTVLQLLPPVAAAAVRTLKVPVPVPVAEALGSGGSLPDVEREPWARAGGNNLASLTEFLMAVGNPVGVAQIGVLSRERLQDRHSPHTVTVTGGTGSLILRRSSVDAIGLEWMTLTAGERGVVHRAVAELLNRAASVAA